MRAREEEAEEKSKRAKIIRVSAVHRAPELIFHSSMDHKSDTLDWPGSTRDLGDTGRTSHSAGYSD